MFNINLFGYSLPHPQKVGSRRTLLCPQNLLQCLAQRDPQEILPESINKIQGTLPQPMSRSHHMTAFPRGKSLGLQKLSQGLSTNLKDPQRNSSEARRECKGR